MIEGLPSLYKALGSNPTIIIRTTTTKLTTIVKKGLWSSQLKFES
jgi:hypothetical protein